MRTLLLTLTTCLLVLPVQAKYSGGSGTAQAPYQIATAADLILLGETPEDYDKHFILTADIDLDPNLPGRKAFDKAVVAPITLVPFPAGGTGALISSGMPFVGTFDGNGHTISHLTIRGGYFLGLFGQLKYPAEVKDLGVVDVNITGSGDYVGGLVGDNAHGWLGGGTVTGCYSTGTVKGHRAVGGLMGSNGFPDTGGGNVTQCYSTGAVSGSDATGGLVGYNDGGTVTQCYSTGIVSGKDRVGGLVGLNDGTVTQCYSTGAVSGNSWIGGLVGDGLPNGVSGSFWDIQTSGQTTSAGGTGKTTAEMQMAATFIAKGWDFIGETANGTDDIWKIADGLGYPRLSWERYSGGTGEPNDPYQIATAADLIALGNEPNDYDKHFILTADIDLDPNLLGRKVFDKAVIAPDTDSNDTYSDFQGLSFTGVFDGNGHTISHLTINGKDYLGLFGRLAEGEIKDVGLVDIKVIGSGEEVAGLVALNVMHSTVTRCYSTGVVHGEACVGGLIGYSSGTMADCYTTAIVSDAWGVYVGQLVGCWPEGGR